jgi:pSer/pThr/pTyr-binding forkhead associated (FHA) protein
MPKLVFIDEPHVGRTYDLVLEKTTVGRGDRNTLVIRDPSVSETHCEILVFGSEVIVRDLGSKNGTFVEGARLQGQQCQLKTGQTVKFGSVRARVEVEPVTAVDQPTEGTAIYERGRFMRERERAQAQPQPADPSLRLGPAPETGQDEHTMLLTRPAPPPPAPAPAPEPPAEPPARKAANAFLWLAVALGLGLIALVWFLSRNR